MPHRPAKLPSYRLHKPSGQAVVTLRQSDGSRRDVYLGPYQSPDSRREYGRIVAELATAAAAGQATRPSGAPLFTIDEPILAFWNHTQQHYRRPDGSQTYELSEYRQTFKPLRKLYGQTRAAEFGPLALTAVREAMIALGWCRQLVNRRVGRVRRVFKWGVARQLVPGSVWQDLRAVEGLQAGRTPAPKAVPIPPVPRWVVEATLPHLNRHVRGLVEFQRLTGCRPGEACQVRRRDTDMTGEVWIYRPDQHNTAWRGKARMIAIGPRAQALLREFFSDDPDDYLFDPRRATAEYHSARSVARLTPRYPSHMARNAAKRVPCPVPHGRREYLVSSYGQAVARAVERANRPMVEAPVDVELHVPNWVPNQLRHSFATEIRRRYGLEAAQVLLGHERADVTQVYAEKNLALATKVAAEIG